MSPHEVHSKYRKVPRLVAASIAAGATMTALAVTASGSTASAAPTPSAPTAAQAQALAAQNTDTLVASRPAFLQASANEQYLRQQITTSQGTQYVPYQRTYAGVPVVGGDFVVVTNSAGQVVFDSVAQQHPIGALSVTPALSSANAAAVASAQLRSVSKVEGTRLVVFALGAGPAALAWESTVDGTGANGISRLTVDVDAHTGAVLRTQENVDTLAPQASNGAASLRNGTTSSGGTSATTAADTGSGTGAWNGPEPLAINDTVSGGTYTLSPTNINNMPCQDAANNTTFTKSSNSWGNGDATSRETGCADAEFVAQGEFKMLSQWLGRNGMDGNGGAWPIRVGLAQVNAYYDGSQLQIGHNNANQWISSPDVVGHEMGHGVDDHTPGGISGNGTQEFIADTYGASTEWFLNEPSPYVVPDWVVGTNINLVGSGPIRNMYNPSLVNNNANCYSSSIPSAEVHAAAGPGNHWFYLLSQGSNPASGPTSPTCDGSTVTGGVGIENAIKIVYNAQLMKTSASDYLHYRTWTLQAAKNLDSTCAEFNTVKAAWDAVSVPAQSADPTCTAGTSDFTMAVSPTSGAVKAGSSLTATVSTTLSSGSAQTVNLSASGLPSGATASFNPTSVSAGGTSQLTISTTGSTPAGTSTVTITGTGTSTTHTATFSLTVNTSGNTVTVTNPGNQTGTVGTAASLQIQASDSATGQTLTYSATGLPAGLSISSAGLISGTPTTAATSNVTVTAKDTTGAWGSTSFTWTVSLAGGGGATVTVTNPGNQVWITGYPFGGVQVKATDSKNLALRFTATGLPPGIVISPSGAITGTATAGGTFTVKVTATDTGGATGTTTFTFTVYAF